MIIVTERMVKKIDGTVAVVRSEISYNAADRALRATGLRKTKSVLQDYAVYYRGCNRAEVKDGQIVLTSDIDGTTCYLEAVK